MCSRSSTPAPCTTDPADDASLAAEKKSFLLRIDPQLWEALAKLAASELRSVNGQVEYLLRDAMSRRGALGARLAQDAEAASVPAAERDDGKASS